MDEAVLNLSLSEVLGLRSQGNAAIVYRQLIFNKETPLSLYQRIRPRGQFSFFLESAAMGFYRENSRFTFIGIEPRMIARYKDHRMRATTGGQTREERIEGHPVDLIRKELARVELVPSEDREFPFVGGAVGYFGYDTVRYYEKIPLPENDPVGIDEGVFAFFDYFFVYDNLTSTLKIGGLVELSGDVAANYGRTASEISRLEAMVRRTPAKPAPIGGGFYFPRGEVALDYQSNTTKARFEEDVRKAREYIKAGDIYQVILSQRLSMATSVDATAIYEVLRSLNPSPYMFFLDVADFQIFGTSPEVMARVRNGQILVCPLAGTRARGRTAEEDKALEKDLLENVKERAEHVMLVDLARNDVGKVSRSGTVHVENLMHVLKFSHVQHLNSEVKGVLSEDKDICDVFRAILPRGTVSGAPKVRAMQIISELERDRRNYYGGALGYFSYDRNLDSALLIRTMLAKDGRVHVQAGAGIVYDSDPEAEYYETLNKAKALLVAARIAQDVAADSRP